MSQSTKSTIDELDELLDDLRLLTADFEERYNTMTVSDQERIAERIIELHTFAKSLIDEMIGPGKPAGE